MTTQSSKQPNPNNYFLGKHNRRLLGNGVHLSWATFASDFFIPSSLPVTLALSQAGLLQASTKRQAEFWAGRRLAHISAGIENLPRALSGAPVWPTGRNGAISHSRHCVALIDGPDNRRLGIDVETVFPPANVTALKARILTEKERLWLQAFPEERQARMLTLVFSAKESSFKALSSEIQGKPAFTVVELEPVLDLAVGRWKLHLTLPLGRQLSEGYIVRGGFVWHEDRILTWTSQPRETVIPLHH